MKRAAIILRTLLAIGIVFSNSSYGEQGQVPPSAAIPIPPAPPGNIEVVVPDLSSSDQAKRSDPDYTAIEIHWSASDQKATGYIVEKQQSSGKWETLSEVAVGILQVADIAFANHRCKYRVYAIEEHEGQPRLVSAMSGLAVYQAPIIKKFQIRMHSEGQYKDGFPQYIDPESPVDLSNPPSDFDVSARYLQKQVSNGVNETFNRWIRYLEDDDFEAQSSNNFNLYERVTTSIDISTHQLSWTGTSSADQSYNGEDDADNYAGMSASAMLTTGTNNEDLMIWSGTATAFRTSGSPESSPLTESAYEWGKRQVGLVIEAFNSVPIEFDPIHTVRVSGDRTTYQDHNDLDAVSWNYPRDHGSGSYNDYSDVALSHEYPNVAFAKNMFAGIQPFSNEIDEWWYVGGLSFDIMWRSFGFNPNLNAWAFSTCKSEVNAILYRCDGGTGKYLSIFTPDQTTEPLRVTQQSFGLSGTSASLTVPDPVNDLSEGNATEMIKQNGVWQFVPAPKLLLYDSTSPAYGVQWYWALDEQEKRSPGATILPGDPDWTTGLRIQIPTVAGSKTNLTWSGADSLLVKNSSGEFVQSGIEVGAATSFYVVSKKDENGVDLAKRGDSISVTLEMTDAQGEAVGEDEAGFIYLTPIVKMKKVDRDDPLLSGTDMADCTLGSSVYAAESIGDMVCWYLAEPDKWFNKSIYWVAEGPEQETIYGPAGVGSMEWKIADDDLDTGTDWLMWRPGKWKIKVMHGSAVAAEFDQEIGWRSDDWAVVGQIVRTNEFQLSAEEGQSLKNVLYGSIPFNGMILAMDVALLGSPLAAAFHQALHYAEPEIVALGWAGFWAYSPVRVGRIDGLSDNQRYWIVQMLLNHNPDDEIPIDQTIWAPEELRSIYGNRQYRFANRFQCRFKIDEDGRITQLKQIPTSVTAVGTTKVSVGLQKGDIFNRGGYLFPSNDWDWKWTKWEEEPDRSPYSNFGESLHRAEDQRSLSWFVSARVSEKARKVNWHLIGKDGAWVYAESIIKPQDHFPWFVTELRASIDVVKDSSEEHPFNNLNFFKRAYQLPEKPYVRELVLPMQGHLDEFIEWGSSSWPGPPFPPFTK